MWLTRRYLNSWPADTVRRTWSWKLLKTVEMRVTVLFTDSATLWKHWTSPRIAHISQKKMNFLQQHRKFHSASGAAQTVQLWSNPGCFLCRDHCLLWTGWLTGKDPEVPVRKHQRSRNKQLPPIGPSDKKSYSIHLLLFSLSLFTESLQHLNTCMYT